MAESDRVRSRFTSVLKRLSAAAFRCTGRRHSVVSSSLAEAWPDSAIVPQLVARLLWGHLRVLLDRLKNRETREWHQRAAVEYGWSRNILVHQISSRLHERELPAPIQGEVPSVEDVQEVVEKQRAELADLGSKPDEVVQGTMSNEPCGKEARTPA